MDIKYVCDKCGGKVSKIPTGKGKGLGKWHCENGCSPCKVRTTVDKHG